jgi:hypothetical protein
MGTPDYTEVLVKASEPYWVGDEDMAQLGQEESARWYARQSKGTPEGNPDDSEGLYEDDEDVVVADGRTLPLWLVTDDNHNLVGAPKRMTGNMSCVGQAQTLAAQLPSFPRTQHLGSGLPPAPMQLELSQHKVSAGFPLVTGTTGTYSTVASTFPSGVLHIPDVSVGSNRGLMMQTSIGQTLDQADRTTKMQPNSFKRLNTPSPRLPSTSNHQGYVAHKAKLPLTQRSAEQSEMAQGILQLPNLLTDDLECPIVDVNKEGSTGITTNLSYPAVGVSACRQKQETVQDMDISIDQLLFTPNASARSSLGTPVQDEVQLQVTDVYDPLYQEAFGTNNHPPAKKSRVEPVLAQQEVPSKQLVGSGGTEETSATVERETAKERVTQSCKVTQSNKGKNPLNIEFQQKNELTTADAIMEAAKMICKALDDQTRAARCSEKASLKIAGELERIERKLTKMERTIASRSRGETSIEGDEDINNNKENAVIEQRNSGQGEIDTSKKREPLKSVIHQVKRKK